MFSFTRKKGEESKFSKVIERMAERRGLRRHRSSRAQSAPPRQPAKVSESPTETEEKPRDQRPTMYQRGRSASCTALDWFAGDLTWRDVETGGYLARSGSYRSVEHEGPVLDVRHDCVKSSSPTVVHQDGPYTIAPLTAVVEGAPSPTAGRSAPPPTPVKDVNYGATSRATVDEDRIDALAEVAGRRRIQKPLLSVEIPNGSLSPPAEIYEQMWGNL